MQINSIDKHNQEHKDTLKTFADKTIEIARCMKLWKVDPSKWQQETSDFTKEIDLLMQQFTVSKYYDLIRNYVTQKPFSVEKMKLNFDCSTLLR
jgi:CRISPR-associated protein Cpf1